MISVVKKQGPKYQIIYLCRMKVGSDVQSVDICRGFKIAANYF
jgi:hypothetical protein